MGATIKDWITVNGNHIPLFEGESKEEAVSRFTENKRGNDEKTRQIANNKAEANRLNKQDPPKQLRLSNVKAEDANKSSDVLNLRTKQRYRFKEGTDIRNVYVFAGKGCAKEFRDAEKYAKRYAKYGEGKAEDWQHCAGMARITDGRRVLNREVHWVQGKSGKIREAFIKEHYDSNSHLETQK